MRSSPRIRLGLRRRAAGPGAATEPDPGGQSRTLSLTVEDRRRLERDLLAHYLEIWNTGGGEPISWDDAWLAHRVHAGYTVLASCQVVTFPADATPQRQVFAAAFLERSQAAVADLDARAAIKEFGGL